MPEAQAKIRVTVDGAEQAKSKLGGINSQLVNMAKAAVSIYAVAKAARFVSAAVQEQERATVNLNAALKNTGIYSATFSKALQDNASAIQKMTTYGDEAILMGTALAQNIGKLSDDLLPKAQKAAVGLAAAYNMDLQTAFTLIGKAAAGNTALLGRYGIVVDESLSQAEKFAQVLELGAGKFSIAEAAAQTLSGRMQQLKNMVGDTAEIVGAAIIPAFTDLIEEVMPLVDVVGAELSPLFSDLIDTMKPLLSSLVEMAKSVLPPLVKVIDALMPVIDPIIAILSDLIVIVGDLAGGILTSLMPVFEGLARVVKTLLTPFELLFGLSSNYTAEQKTMAKSMEEVRAEAEIEAQQFRDLADRLLELRRQTDLTGTEKGELKRIVSELNSQYGTLLGNVNLETAAYNSLATAVNSAASALMNKQVAEGLKGVGAEQARRVAELRVQLAKAIPYNQDELIALQRAAEGGGQGGGADYAASITKRHNEFVERIRAELKTAEAELALINKEMQAVLSGVAITASGGAAGSGAGVVSQTIKELNALADTWGMAADVISTGLENQIQPAWDGIILRAQILTDNAKMLGLTYEDFFAQQSILIDNTIMGWKQAGVAVDGYKDKALAGLPELYRQIMGIEGEQALGYDDIVKQHQEVYDLVNGMVNTTVNGFQMMIAQGKSFGEAMKNIWKDIVAVALGELAKLTAVFAVKSIMTSLFPAAVGLGQLATQGAGLLSTGGGMNTMPIPAYNSNAQLIAEVRALRQDVYNAAAMPTVSKIDYTKGTLARAVNGDQKYVMEMQ